MRILSISSQVAWGPVGNTAAVPALQAKGHEVLSLPTITLSNHPGHGKPAGFRTAPEDLGKILDALESHGVLAGLDAALAGYFASPEQVDVVAKVLARVQPRHVLVDPVIGDEAGLYVPQAVADAIRAHLLPLATCITPNRFELEWLSGIPVTDEANAIAAARRTGVSEVLATSIPAGAGQLSTLLVTATDHHAIVTPKLDHVPHGTGDFLSGLYLAERVNTTPQAALGAAMAILTRAIARSAGTSVLDVAGALHSS